MASGWCVDSVAVDEDELKWDDREEGILLSVSPQAIPKDARPAKQRLEQFLDNPLHPLATPYPPGTLPPSSALDDITSQIIRFHSPPTPLGGNTLNLTDLIPSRRGLPNSTSSPALSTAKRPHASKHRRTHSASGIPWKHSWKATRRKLYEIARREALGYLREDRFKGRVISSPTDDTASVDLHTIDIPATMLDGLETPMTRHQPPTPSANIAETPSGRILKRPGGGMAMQRHGSETFLEFPSSIGPLDLGIPLMDGPAEQEGQERRTIGQALRLSSSLQRSAKASSETRPGTFTVPRVWHRAKPSAVRPAGIQRKSSLLQRGQSFTADDFNNCLSLSSDTDAFVDQACETPSIVFDQTGGHRAFDTTTPQATESNQDLFGKMFGQHNDMVSPPSSIFGSDGYDMSMDSDTVPATPDHVQLPCIMLTKTSPSPMIHARNGSGSSDMEISSPSTQKPLKKSALGTPLSFSAPTSPKFQLGALDAAPDLDLTPRPVLNARPGLVRARSSTAAHKSPSAFAQFMNNTPGPSICVKTATPGTVEPPLRSPTRVRLPTAKRQKLGFGLTLPMPGASAKIDSGLASPFDEKSMF